MRYAKEFLGQRLIWFLTSVCLISGYGVISTFGTIRTLVAMLIGALFIVFVEYVIHRYVLHEFPKIAPFAYQGHVAHHQYPQDVKYLFGPVTFDVCGYLFIFLAAFLVTGFDWHLTISVVFGASGFQIYYQWKHYISHRPITPLTPWGKWLKKTHLLHHHLDEHSWYGVSNPVLDIVMGTNRPQKSKSDSPASANQEEIPL